MDAQVITLILLVSRPVHTISGPWFVGDVSNPGQAVTLVGVSSWSKLPCAVGGPDALAAATAIASPYNLGWLEDVLQLRSM